MKSSYNKKKGTFAFILTRDEYLSLQFLVCAGVVECHFKTPSDTLTEYRELRDNILNADLKEDI